MVLANLLFSPRSCLNKKTTVIRFVTATDRAWHLCALYKPFFLHLSCTSNLATSFFLYFQGKTGGNALDRVGGSGHMKAAGGGSNLEDQQQGGSGRRMQFTKERGWFRLGSQVDHAFEAIIEYTLLFSSSKNWALCNPSPSLVYMQFSSSHAVEEQVVATQVILQRLQILY